MNFGKLADQAKKLIGKRGGVKSLEADALELKDIAESKGSFSHKAEEAATALKDPGAPGEEPAPGGTPPAQPGGTPPAQPGSSGGS